MEPLNSALILFPSRRTTARFNAPASSSCRASAMAASESMARKVCSKRSAPAWLRDSAVSWRRQFPAKRAERQAYSTSAEQPIEIGVVAGERKIDAAPGRDPERAPGRVGTRECDDRAGPVDRSPVSGGLCHQPLGTGSRQTRRQPSPAGRGLRQVSTSQHQPLIPLFRGH